MSSWVGGQVAWAPESGWAGSDLGWLPCCLPGILSSGDSCAGAPGSAWGGWAEGTPAYLTAWVPLPPSRWRHSEWKRALSRIVAFSAG